MENDWCANVKTMAKTEEPIPMRACILLKTKSGTHNETAEAAAGIVGVKVAFPVLGRFDVAIRVETSDLSSLGETVTELNKMPSVLSSETLVELVR